MANIDINTKIIARLHKTDNGTGLNIYNPYFEAVGINATYLLFVSDDPAKLLCGIRDLNIAGAITAGFETDPNLPPLADNLDETVSFSGRVGILINAEGKLTARYQGGEGLLNAILNKFNLDDKEIIIVGAGTVAKTLLLAIESSGIITKSVKIVNRTVDKAKEVAARFSFVDEVIEIDRLSEVSGDIIINTTRIGSKVEDTYFTPELIERFVAVADVTFMDPNTNLVKLAQAKNKIAVDGTEMFTYQAAVVLRYLLNHDADIPTLRKFVLSGLGR
jgi:shikimate 5-dehydrogenase